MHGQQKFFLFDGRPAEILKQNILKAHVTQNIPIQTVVTLHAQVVDIQNSVIV